MGPMELSVLRWLSLRLLSQLKLPLRFVVSGLPSADAQAVGLPTSPSLEVERSALTVLVSLVLEEPLSAGEVPQQVASSTEPLLIRINTQTPGAPWV